MYSGKLLMMGRGTARNIWEISASVGFIKKKTVVKYQLFRGADKSLA
jgi:hypothetical protein